MKPGAKLNSKVDSYIAKAQPFAQPIMEHLRELVHQGCPEVEETIKWSRPFFAYRRAILGNMAAFKKHCSFGFWGAEMGDVLREVGMERANGADSLGKIESLDDLPADKVMVSLIKRAAGFIASGEQRSPIAARHKAVKAEGTVVVAPELVAALKKDKKAAAVFAGFSPSAQREYMEWVTEAKRAETREKRVMIAVEWIGEGKQRNWKYQGR